jgi:hypothetical protein
MHTRDDGWRREVISRCSRCHAAVCECLCGARFHQLVNTAHSGDETCACCDQSSAAQADFRKCLSIVQASFTMLMGVNGMNNGINYDPMNPMGTHDWKKDAKAANRIAGLVTKCVCPHFCSVEHSRKQARVPSTVLPSYLILSTSLTLVWSRRAAPALSFAVQQDPQPGHVHAPPLVMVARVVSYQGPQPGHVHAPPLVIPRRRCASCRRHCLGATLEAGGRALKRIRRRGMTCRTQCGVQRGVAWALTTRTYYSTDFFILICGGWGGVRRTILSCLLHFVFLTQCPVWQ